MKQTVDTAINFNKADYAANIHKYNNIIEAVKVVRSALNALPDPFCIFDTSVLRDIQENGIYSIKAAYAEFIEGEITRQAIKVRSQVAVYRGSVEEDLGPLNDAINKIKQRQEIEAASSNPNQFITTLDNLEIHNGEIVVSESAKEMLRRYYSVIIETEEQAEIWEGFIKLKKAWDEQIARLAAVGITCNQFDPMCSSPRVAGFVEEDDNTGELHLRPISFVVIQQHIRAMAHRAAKHSVTKEMEAA
jgi:hypothetical protein